MPTATLMSTSGSGWSSTTARAVEWSEVTECLRRGGWSWLSTVRPDDRLDAPYGAPTSGGPPYAVISVVPRRAFAFPVSEEEFAPTRFTFEDGS